MCKAEKSAEEYAKKFILTVDHLSDAERAFRDGYEQAEEDLELTWKDLKLLQNISQGIFAETANGRAEFYQVYPTEQSFFEEILKRFKERKGK
jgi:hypothetical protein